MPIQLPESARIVTPQPQGDGIELPYLAPLAWWTNARPGPGEVNKFGGWACKAGDFDMAAAQYGEWPQWERVQSDLGELVQIRYLAIAPFGARRRWMDVNKGDSKTGTHLQQLAYVAIVTQEKKYIPWGPMILSLKVTAAMRFRDLLTDWARATARARDEVAPDVPAHFFWMPVGTFGKEPVFETVGKGNHTSQVTLPHLATEGEIAAPLLEKLYVGDEIAEKMADLFQQSQEWLRDKKWQESGGLDEAHVEPVEDDEFVRHVPPPPPAWEDVPF